MYKCVSLFSGALGLDIGLEMAGFEAIAYVEKDKTAIATIKENRRNTPIFEDITKISPEEILSKVNLPPSEVDLVVGGPPCQSFSTAGKRLSVKDPRGNLIYHFLRMVNGIRPRFFVLENVKGLVSAAINHRPLAERNGEPLSPEEELGSAFVQIRKDIAAILGYKFIWAVVDSVYYGAPQFRERMVLIGSRDGEDIFIPQPTHFMVHQDPKYRWRTLRDAIGDLENNPGPGAKFTPERARYLDLVPPGGNWRSLPENMIPIAMGGAYESGGGKVGFYRRLSYDEPCPTLVTSPLQKG